mmetsp:Transcript_57501/g.136788  ORF Transcript_57501/g.136788 Transcript_57501/m.136788 type:complete len:504 (+) Transcript_57501:79-1590(+)
MGIGEEELVNPSSVSEELHCSICTELFAEPKECEHCQTAFCASCIEEWLTKEASCPHCRVGTTTARLSPAHRYLKQAVGKVLAKCPRPNCIWTGALDRRASHACVEVSEQVREAISRQLEEKEGRIAELERRVRELQDSKRRQEAEREKQEKKLAAHDREKQMMASKHEAEKDALIRQHKQADNALRHAQAELATAEGKHVQEKKEMQRKHDSEMQRALKGKHEEVCEALQASSLCIEDAETKMIGTLKATFNELKQAQMNATTAFRSSIAVFAGRPGPSRLGGVQVNAQGTQVLAVENAATRQQAGVYIFASTSYTIDAIKKHLIFGAPSQDLGKMKSGISADTRLLLFEASRGRFVGPFVPDGQAQMDIVPGAFGVFNKAQIRFKVANVWTLRELFLQEHYLGALDTEQASSMLTKLETEGSLLEPQELESWMEATRAIEQAAKRPRLGAAPNSGQGASSSERVPDRVATTAPAEEDGDSEPPTPTEPPYSPRAALPEDVS